MTHNSYNPEWLRIPFDKAKLNIIPKQYKKNYLSRTKLKLGQKILNVSYFENLFEKQGVKIINPEQLPYQEQISYITGAEEIACTMGTLSHWLLFGKDNANAKLLYRDHEYDDNTLSRQSIINELKNIRCIYIDVSLNFLPSRFHFFNSKVVGPTQYRKQFVKSKNFSGILTCTSKICLLRH